MSDDASTARIPAIVDTHVHLDDPAFDDDRDAVLSAARAAGIVHFINIGYSPQSWENSRLLRDRYPDVDIAIGLHPQLADEFDATLARNLREAVKLLRPVALGEMGLDYSRPSPSRGMQLAAFRAQLDLAGTEELPVVIHQRAAADDVIEALAPWTETIPVVLHSFDATPRLAAWAAERGCFIGIGGLATKPSSAPLRELLRTMPVDRLLLETDSPYLPPPGTPNRRNDPSRLPQIAATLSPLWNLGSEEICRVSTATAKTVFRLASAREVEQ
jgi:TatD DNase family protein